MGKFTEIIKDIIGMTEEEAQSYTELRYFEFRVLTRDGKPVMKTDDIRHNRINVSIMDGIVTSIISIGI